MSFRSHSALALALSLCACGDPYEPAPPTSPETYAIELAAAYCSFGVRCEGPESDHRFSVFCHPIAVEQELGYLLERQPHMAFDALAAMRCLQTIEEATLGCVAPVCEPVLIGTRTAGAACDERGQCEPGLVCAEARGRGRCSGSCAPAAGEGDRCRDDHECADGLRCDRDRCVPEGDEGDWCERRSDCRDDLRCDRERGECFAPSDAEGRECDDDGSCPLPTRCVDDACTRYEPGLAGPGEDCAPGECAANHFCDGGVCAPNPTLTEPCDDERACVEGRCVSGTCQLLPPRASCRTDRECATDRCMGTCAVPAAVGARCERDRDCANGLQCDEGRCSVRGPCG